MRSIRILASTAVLFAALQSEGQAEPASLQETEHAALETVPIGEIEVGGEIGRRIALTIRQNILKLDFDGLFMEPFRRQSWPEGGGDYGGYVGLGKTLDALVRFAAYSRDPALTARKDELFDELLATQTAEGYIGTFAATHRVTSAFDLHEMVYIMQALVDDHRYFGSTESLEAARRLADFVMQQKPAQWLRDEVHDVRKLNVERAFLAVGDATGENRYREYGVESLDLRNWQPNVEGHAYWFLNRCLAQVDLYRVEGKPKLLEESHKALDFLTRGDGLVITGTCSLGEQFHTQQEGLGNLGESCATAYLIRLLHNLMQLEPKSRYGDIMERAIFNSLFAAQSPDGRRLRYYTCFEGPRAYMNVDTYCCPGNWRRIASELPEMIYYTGSDGIFVNLYTRSKATVRIGQGGAVELRQETDYPNSGDVTLRVDPAETTEFTLRLRIPAWCEDPRVSVNGEGLSDVTPGSFVAVRRLWKRGDVVRLSLPMEPRLIRGRKSQQGKAAVLRGPVVFCLGNQGRSVDEMSRLRARIATVDAALGGLDGRPVDLADVVGGGGGFGGGRKGHGIDPRTGRIVGGRIGEVWWHTANEFGECESPFVDGIVVPNGARGPVPISSTGLKVEGVPATCGMTNGYLVNGPTDRRTWTPADGPEYGAAVSPMAGLPEPWYTTQIDGVDFGASGHSALGIEANKAITFDLAAIREATGYGDLTFRAVAAYSGRAEPTVDLAVYVDGAPVLARTALTRQRVDIRTAIGAEARFLTLMVTDGNGQKNDDGGFTPGDAVLLGDPVLIPEGHRKEADGEDLRERLESEKAALAEEAARYLEPLDRPARVVVDGASLRGPEPDGRIRPDGQSLLIDAWSADADPSQPPNITLRLSEFADPEGRVTYFRVADSSEAGEDELFTMTAGL